MLDKLVDQYNNSVNSSIKMSPVQACQKKIENNVFGNLYPDIGGKTVTPYFSVGDNVRITKKLLFEKDITPRWIEEVLTINKIILTIQTTYKITDLNGKKLKVHFMNRSCKRRRRTHSESKQY